MLLWPSVRSIAYLDVMDKINCFPTGDYLADSVINKLKDNKNNNCFIWTHFLDVHQSQDIIHRNRFIPFWKSIEINDQNNHQWDQIVLSSTIYVDKQLGKIKKYLSSVNQLEDSLVILTADHGLTPSYPIRNEGRSRNWFYEEFIKVPMIFYGKGIKNSINDKLCGHIDLLPTLLDILKIKDCEGMKGKSLISSEYNDREYLIIENLGLGMCDFAHKPIQITLRSEKYKYFWIESSNKLKNNWLFKEQWENLENLLFDLHNDPLEKNNIIKHPSVEEIQKKFQRICEKRCEELRKTN